MKRTFVLRAHPHPVRARLIALMRDLPDGHIVTVSEPSRNAEQNALMWAILQEFASQKEWATSRNDAWDMGLISKEAWKDILTAAFERESPRMAQAYGSQGMVMLGARTSQYGKRRFAEWIEFLFSAAADLGVQIRCVAPDDVEKIVAQGSKNATI